MSMKRKLTPAKGGRPTPAKVRTKAAPTAARLLAAADVDDMLCCPITHEVMQDPVICADGASLALHGVTICRLQRGLRAWMPA